MTSTNGVDWLRRDSHTHQDLFGAAYGNGTFVAVGDAGTIVQTARPFPRFHTEETRLSDDGLMRMVLETPTGIDFTLEASSDFNSWIPVETVANSFGLLELSDPASPTLGRRFYRVKKLSP